ncbi:DUF2207 domain-containing protein [Robertmurraya sp. DFI.2.37]|uniref:DUF2207 domain-containing protein n=1 Tax=Robertmurraya sp. DFI.2.37 TaxID=3031819 RepID=UPI001248F1CE|nr:DUF2207 domain-containing protein [Robertmurraya sp. DFI.2.37]MDF1510574.1 DUF2207 domain-containing protein [Robertmurraya sp. DFI.2.37]
MFFFLPKAGLAVDYSITSVSIDAFLLENGNVNVEEIHTYSFDGDFNGITREIIPKEGTKIKEFKATENGKSLKIEKDEALYKIHRKGANETITIAITYTITNGVNVYADVAEFYWPFFDDRNESTYEKMMITIHPPAATDDVIAFGYAQAFEREVIQQDHSVLFQLGKVPDGENGDIRVAYPASLFPTANVTADKEMRGEILKAQTELYEKAAARAKMQESLHSASLYVAVVSLLFLVLFILIAGLRTRGKKMDVERKMQQAFFIPKETLSIPAMIYFTKGYIPTEAVSAALLDLVRKGFVTKTDERFQLVKSEPANQHEEILINFLFYEVGSSGEFQFEDLQKYTRNKLNHEKYQTKMHEWQKAVQMEVKTQPLYEIRGKLRWTFAILGILQLAYSFLTLGYELFGWFFAFLILSGVYIVLAISYRPKTWNGLMIKHEWQRMKEQLPQISMKTWENLSDDEQMRSYIYGVGTNDKKIIETNENFIQAFKRPSTILNSNHNVEPYGTNIHSLLLIGPLASSNFHSAHKTTSESTTSSSSSMSSGGGVGGGGGGSGAF